MRLNFRRLKNFFSTLEPALKNTPSILKKISIASLPERVIACVPWVDRDESLPTVVTVFNLTQLLDHTRRTSFHPTVNHGDFELASKSKTLLTDLHLVGKQNLTSILKAN